MNPINSSIHYREDQDLSDEKSDIEEQLSSLDHTKKQILFLLALYPYSGYQKLGEKLGISMGSVKSHFKENKEDDLSLIERGLVHRTGHGWLLTQLGGQYIRELQRDEEWWEIHLADLQLTSHTHG